MEKNGSNRLTMSLGGHELAARVLGAKHSSTQLSCNCEYQHLKITISFIPYGDDALLYNRTNDILHVESVPNQLSTFEVEPKDFATIYPGCWRVRCSKTSIEFRLRPRRYRIVVRQETMKRTAAQSSSSKRVKGAPTAGKPARELGPIETTTRTISREVGSIGLGFSGLTQNQTLNVVDEVTGKVEYSVKYLDRLASSSAFHVFKAILHDKSPGPRPEVVAVKMRKLGEEKYSTHAVAHAMRHWQREVNTHDGLRHPCIASLIAFDARLLALMVEHRESRDLADPHWRTRDGSQRDFFKGDCNDARVVAADMASAPAYLTAKGIVHNDIAPKNILYNRDTSKQGTACTVLIDFGESRSIHETAGISGGRPWYVPPEWVAGERGFPADMWSLGVVMLYLLRRLGLPERNEPEWWIADIPTARSGSAPLRRKQDWLKKVSQLRDGLKDPVCDQGNLEGEKIRRLVGQMLEVDAGQRIEAHDLA